ncbi:MAG: folate family ECF transporter S component [Caldiserica bacterium]|nr:folate family ECF transporter S component [Caldisericota bacterium]
MKKLLWFMKSSTNELKSVSTISVAGMLVAVSVVLSFLKVVISSVLEISFAFLPLAAGGLLYGPVVGGIMGVLSDVLGYYIRPNGPFFPGFTLNALISGALYGLFLYKKPVTLKRVIIVSALIAILINLLLNSLWLSMMYGKAFVVLLTARIVKNVVMFPIDTVLLMALLKFIERFRIRGHLAA